MKVVTFASPAEWRRWLEKNHANTPELSLGFYRKGSSRRGITYPEALDEALCFGWIDGIRRKPDVHRYTIRFTPRRPNSNWSLVNVRHVRRLKAAGRMHAAGLTAFVARALAKSGITSFEQRPRKFPAALEEIFRSRKRAWALWQTQPPGYQRTAIWWVVSEKQAATQQRRLASLIADSTAGQRLGALSRPAKSPGR